MELQTDNVSRNPLHDFCRSFIADHGKEWPPSEVLLADRFVRFFRLDPLPFRRQLQQLASQLGIEISSAPLPEELAGIHFGYRQVGKIIVSNKDPYLLSAEQTILHELREMLEHTFRGLGYPTSSGASLEERAENFAFAARTCGLGEFWEPLLQRAAEEQSWWRKAGLVVLIIVGSMAYGLGCAIVPFLEKSKLDGRRKSQFTFQNGTPPVIEPPTGISGAVI